MEEQFIEANPKLLAAFAALVAEVEKVAEAGDSVTVDGTRAFLMFRSCPDEEPQRQVFIDTPDDTELESGRSEEHPSDQVFAESVDDGDAVAVVYVLPEEMAETVGCTVEQAKAWLVVEDHLGAIREALYPQPEIYYLALVEAWEATGNKVIAPDNLYERYLGYCITLVERPEGELYGIVDPNGTDLEVYLSSVEDAQEEIDARLLEARNGISHPPAI